MKKYAITSLLFLTPFVAMAADHCTNPNEYTIDRRCYVTDEQKTQKPYNAVVKVDGRNGTCTGEVIKGEDGKTYLYTAKHCADSEIKHNDIEEFEAATDLSIRSQNGLYVKVKPYVLGGDTAENTGTEDDWAVYEFKNDDEKNFKSVALEKSSKTESDVKVVGYGGLKVMSDKEISDLHMSYINYLKGEEIVGFYEDFLVSSNKTVLEFIKNMPEFNDDDNLKLSKCRYYSGYLGGVGCQGWQGNSGGPVLDTEDKVMAIITRGVNAVGGSSHAGIGAGTTQSVRINNIKLPERDKTDKK